MNLNMTLIGQAISFGIFIWFCMKHVWPPITQALQERQKKIADGLAAAERGAEAQEEAKQAAGEELAAAKAQAAEIVAQAQKRSNEIVAEAKENAVTESDRIKASAQSEIEQQVFQAKEELRKQVGALALEGAQKIIGKEIDGSAHAVVIDDLAARI